MKQEMFQKPPAGYRKATPEEQQKIMDCGMMIQLTNAKVAQNRAELDAAQLRLRSALSDQALASNQQGQMFRDMKLEGKPGDIHGGDFGVFILEDRSKRLEVYPPPPEVKLAKIDPKAIKAKPAKKGPGPA